MASYVTVVEIRPIQPATKCSPKGSSLRQCIIYILINYWERVPPLPPSKGENSSCATLRGHLINSGALVWQWLHDVPVIDAAENCSGGCWLGVAENADIGYEHWQITWCGRKNDERLSAVSSLQRTCVDEIASSVLNFEVSSSVECILLKLARA